MWDAWTKLSEWNVDHYVNHRAAHSGLIGLSSVVAVGAVIGAAKLAQRDQMKTMKRRLEQRR